MAPKAKAKPAAQPNNVITNDQLEKVLKAKKEWQKCNLTHMEVADGGAVALANTLPKWTQIHELCLGHNSITTVGITKMSNADQGGPLPSVVNLDLTRNNFDEWGARALLDNLCGSKTLEFLTLDKNDFSQAPEQLACLVKHQGCKLLTLNLAQCELQPDNVTSISKGLAESTGHLRVLDLSHNDIGPSGAKSLAEGLVTPMCAMKELNLYRTKLGPQGVCILAAVLEKTKLTSLNVCYNDIRAEGAQALARPLASEDPKCPLEVLKVSFNQIGAGGACALAESLAKPSCGLLEFRTGTNDIGLVGLQALCDALIKNETLTELGIRKNGLGDEGAKVLGRALPQMKSLQKLGLQRNEIQAQGAQDLAEGLRDNRSVTSLEATDNSFEDGGARAIANMLLARKDFKLLHLGKNQITEAVHLARALTRHPGLEEVELHKNWFEWKEEDEEGGTLLICKALKDNAKLKRLYLSNNRVYGQGADLLRQNLANCILEELDVTNCYFGAYGISALADVLGRGGKLRILRIASNELEDQGAKDIAQAIGNNMNLQELDLGMNKITAVGAKELAEAFPRSNLVYVDMQVNPLGDVGVLLLQGAITGMKSLGEFNLKMVGLEPETPLAAETERKLLGARWTNAKKFKKSPPKIRLGTNWEQENGSDSEVERALAGA